MKTKNPHAQSLGKLGGLATTEPKRRASRLNGKKGGRPKKAPQEGEDLATKK